MKKKEEFIRGIRDGLPICFGYISVSFAFGIFAVASGLGTLEALFLSMANVTSAGQFAAVPIIAAGGSLLELALMQLVINARYALMSLSLSQRLGADIRMRDRFLIAFVNTDEVFAVAAGQGKAVERRYMHGLILTPFLGWSVGTLLGAAAGDILPGILVSALGVAIYGMFVAIVLPSAKKSKPTALCVLLAIFLSCLFYYIPVLQNIPGGFSIIICAVAASAVMAAVRPVVEIEEVDHA
ncbi:MAG: AzlC family ABC transporter permease [Ruminococcaceae bacterium]|nr:AzlC family ABC transporter permease [Oscillospiraceae bacterium]